METLGLAEDAFVAVARVDVSAVVQENELGVDVVEELPEVLGGGGVAGPTCQDSNCRRADIILRCSVWIETISDESVGRHLFLLTKVPMCYFLSATYPDLLLPATS